MLSQARRKPKVRGASWPPAMAAVDHAGADHVEGEADGVGSGGAGSGDGEDGAGDAEVDGDVAGSGVGHGADDGEGMGAGVAGVELGYCGSSAWRPAQEQPRMMAVSVGGVVLEEAAVLGGGAGGDEGELGGALGGGEWCRWRCAGGDRSRRPGPSV